MRILLALLALLLSGCGEKTRAPPPAHDAHPALWVVRDADTTVYLFGTIHLLKPGTRWFDEGVKAAFDRSDQLVLELVSPGDEKMAALFDELGVSKGASLPDQLDAGERARLRSALTGLGMRPDALDRDEPWYAAVLLSVLPLQRLGYDAAEAPEAVLAHAAAEARKPVTGLEAAREQLSWLDRLSPAAQRAMLDQSLDEAPRAAGMLDTMIAAWSKGDAGRLAALMNEGLKDSPELAATMLTARNRRWADWIAARMKTPGTVFVAVGAGHLAGPESVQAELAKRGLRVARVAY